MKTTFWIIAALLCLSLAGYGQAIPWWTVDGGGGKSTGGGLTLASSIGQPAIGVSTGGGLILEAGYLPGARIMSGTTTTMAQQTIAGWNMLSVPLASGDMRRSVLYPGISVAYDYSPSTGYTNRDTLRTGVGYWMKYPSVQGLSFTGQAFAPDTIDVVAGWNLIGMISYPALVADVLALGGTSVVSPYFGYLTTGYYDEDTLKPGLAYWAKCSASGKLVLRAALGMAPMAVAPVAARKGGAIQPASRSSMPPMNVLTVKDAAGQERTVYFSTIATDASLDRFELPPPAPSGLDVRFASQRYVETARSDVRGSQLFPVRISGETLPLTLRWSVAPDAPAATLEILSAGTKPRQISLSGEGSVEITDAEFSGVRLRMDPAAKAELPKEYALHQNFPNPFNPSTTIDYDLPEDARVSLRVYDMIGREVAVLADGVQEAGFKSVVWNADNTAGLSLASGVYFVKLRAGDFAMTRKLMLLR